MLGAARDRERAHDAAQGMMLGMAAGEAIGGEAGLPFTWHALALAETLGELGRPVPAQVVARWLQIPLEHRLAPSSTTGIALRMAAKGLAIGELGPAAAAVAGVGALDLPLVRSLPVALAASRSGAATRAWAQLAAGITHGERLAQLAAVATALLARDLLSLELDDGLVRVSQAIREDAPESFQRHLRRPEPGAGLPDGAEAPAVLGAAVAALAEAGSWMEAVGAASSRWEPHDQLPALVGGLAGARWGRAGVDSSGLAQVPAELRTRLLAAAQLAGSGPVEEPLAPSGWAWGPPG